jgi:hypothetical protein
MRDDAVLAIDNDEDTDWLGCGYPLHKCHCVSKAWRADRVATPHLDWWRGREIVFVSDTHLCCGFGDKYDDGDEDSVDPDVALLDRLMADTFASLGDRLVLLGDTYDLWCAVGGKLPKSRARSAATRALRWSSPFWARWVWGSDSATRASSSADMPWNPVDTYIARNLIDRGAAIFGATASCFSFQPWDALYPAIVATWPRTHDFVSSAVRSGFAYVVAGNHDAAIARHFYDASGAPLPCYNSIEFGDSVRAEHGHRRDFTCDDRTALSYAASCAGCSAGHYAALGLASGINAAIRRTYAAIYGSSMCCCSRVGGTDASDVCAADRASDSGSVAVRARMDAGELTPGPRRKLTAVVFGHTHDLSLQVLPETGALYINSGNSARPVRRVVGSALGRLDLGLEQIIKCAHEDSCAHRLSREELDSLTIDVAKVSFDADGSVSAAEVGTVDIYTRRYFKKAGAAFYKRDPKDFGHSFASSAPLAPLSQQQQASSAPPAPLSQQQQRIKVLSPPDSVPWSLSQPPTVAVKTPAMGSATAIAPFARKFPTKDIPSAELYGDAGIVVSDVASYGGVSTRGHLPRPILFDVGELGVDCGGVSARIAAPLGKESDCAVTPMRSKRHEQQQQSYESKEQHPLGTSGAVPEHRQHRRHADSDAATAAVGPRSDRAHRHSRRESKHRLRSASPAFVADAGEFYRVPDDHFVASPSSMRDEYGWRQPQKISPSASRDDLQRTRGGVEEGGKFRPASRESAYWS